MYSEKQKQKIMATVCKRMSNGESIRTICKSPRFPHVDTIYDWLDKSPIFSEQYTRAGTRRAECHFDEMLEIADTSTPATLGVDTLRIKTREWIVPRLDLKRYGAKQDITSGDKPIAYNTDATKHLIALVTSGAITKEQLQEVEQNLLEKQSDTPDYIV